MNQINPRNILLEHIIDENEFEKKNLPIYEHINTFFNQVKFRNNINSLLQQILKGNAIAVSDALVIPEKASSFVITTNGLQCACTGSNGVPQGPERMDSYRAELNGIFSIICALARLNLIHDIKDGSITVACDNKVSHENALCHDIRAALKRSSHELLGPFINYEKIFL